MLRVASVNVNGIRAAYRRGMADWLRSRRPDVLTLQEVRASDAILADHLGGDWHVGHAESDVPGRAGVAVATRTPALVVRTGVGDPQFDGTGRWVEADLAVDGGVLTVISAYVHKGGVGTASQDHKYAFLDAVSARLATLRAQHRHVLLTGDLNIAHAEVDIKNWKGNRKSSGFLPDERAWVGGLLADGWVDLGRHLGGDGPGPYTWWSWRGQAFDNDSGWRIDYQVADPALAALASRAEVDRAPSYAERLSDHAPVVVDYAVDEVAPTPVS